MSEIVKIGDATLYHAGYKEVFDLFPKCFAVGAIITSPPYANQRTYGGQLEAWDSMMDGLMCAPECQMLINLGQIHVDGEVSCYWESWRDRMRSSGWRFFGQYVWDQGDGLPGNWSGRLAPSHEYILHFNKESRGLNKWVRSKSGHRKPSGGGLRDKQDKVTGLSSPDKSCQTHKVADSVIRVYREMRRDVDHPAVFPVKLPEELCLSFTSVSECVIDPFMGSGTTGVACANLGRKFIGIEIERKYFDIACERIEAAYSQWRLFT